MNANIIIIFQLFQFQIFEES